MVKNSFIILLIGVMTGLLVYHYLLCPKPQHTVHVVKEIEIDTLYIEKTNTVYITETQIKHEYLRDTVYFDKNVPISSFKSSYSHVYGNIDISGEVMGKILNMALKTDFRIPSVTNSITKTETIIKKPQGIYLGAGISNFSASVGGVYLNDRNLFQYSYYPQINGHSIGYFRKVF